jgi:hypothetical protein
MLRLPIRKNHNERLPRAPQEFNRNEVAEGSWGSVLLTGERQRGIAPRLCNPLDMLPKSARIGCWEVRLSKK